MSVAQKACTRCDQVKPLSDYQKRNREKCKARTKSVYTNDEGYKEATKARAKQWHDENRERYNAHTRRRYWDGYREVERAKKLTDEYRAIKRARERKRLLDPDKFARSRHSIRQSKYKRRAALENAGSFTQAEWRAMCEHYGNQCLCCGRSDVKLTVDHVVPLLRNGANTIDNLQPLCWRCNTAKNAKTIDYRPDKGARFK